MRALGGFDRSSPPSGLLLATPVTETADEVPEDELLDLWLGHVDDDRLFANVTGDGEPTKRPQKSVSIPTTKGFLFNPLGIESAHYDGLEGETGP